MDWKRWLKRVAGTVVLIVVVRTVWLAGEREWRRMSGEKELTVALAEADERDPDWRWEALNAKRPRPPAGKNAADRILAIKSLTPTNWGYKLDLTDEGMTREPPPTNHRFPPDQITAIRTELDRARAAVELARTLKDYPSGHREYRLAINPICTLLDQTQHTREVANLLRWDVAIAVEDGNTVQVADDLLAMLNNSRSLGDEPFLISQLVRIATRAVAARSLEWVLAHGELQEPQLAALQSAWAADAEEPLLLFGLRGERACSDVLLLRIQTGEIPIEDVIGKEEGSVRRSAVGFGLWRQRARLPRDRAYLLRWFNQAIEAARLPVHEQPRAMEALPHFDKPGARGAGLGGAGSEEENDLIFSRLLISSVSRVAVACWRGAAEARCAAVGLACERFRLKSGRWPKGLSELPADLLPGGVPFDPFDAKPLRYRNLDDGVVVYSVGPDGTDDGGTLARSGLQPATGTDVGFRLWNPEHRRKPPLPGPPPDQPDPEIRP
jgi:hypothetical protein